MTAPDKAAYDGFGFSVTQSGNILAVGYSHSRPDGVFDAGAAYLYQLESNGSATYLTKVTAPVKLVNDSFGWSVSQSGNILTVGDSGSGVVYTFDISGFLPVQTTSPPISIPPPVDFRREPALRHCGGRVQRHRSRCQCFPHFHHLQREVGTEQFLFSIGLSGYLVSWWQHVWEFSEWNYLKQSIPPELFHQWGSLPC